MLFPNGKLLLCSPHYFDVRYEINPWMSVQRPPEQLRARKQWQTLHHTLLRLGAWIEYIEPLKDSPDMVYSANAGLIRDGICVLARFRPKERQGETPSCKSWFLKEGYQVFELSAGFFEGEGDALFAGETLFCGYGFRSEKQVYGEVASILNVKKLVYCELVDPRFYHLDTCFCPISKDKAIYYPEAFSKDSLIEMKKAIELIPVFEDEAKRFACNAVLLGSSIVIPSGCPQIMQTLSGLGLEPYDVELGEFLKGGGAAKCLVLRL